MALNLAFDTVGSGPPLLVLHGLFGSSSNWLGVARSLAATHTVHCVDLRNHGASPWADVMAYTEMADDVLQLMDRLALRQAAVMGHSMGGKTAMAMALRYPLRVSRLVLVDIAPVSYTDTPMSFAQAMHGIDLLAAGAPAEVWGRLQWVGPRSSAVPFAVPGLMPRNDHFDWRVNLVGIGAAMPQLCGFPSELLGARFDGPVAVLAGARSDYVAQRDGAAFLPMFPQAAVHVVADAGHWVHADQPTAFIRHVQQALHAAERAPTIPASSR